MDKIELEYVKNERRLNHIKPEHGTTKEDKRIAKDDFFIVENEEVE